MSPSCRFCCCSSLSFLCNPLLSSEPPNGLRGRSFLRSPFPPRSHFGTRFSEKIRRNGPRRSPSAIAVVSMDSKVVCGLLFTDPWSPTVNSESIATQLFAISLFPYIGFLYYITRSKTAPKLTLFGFYFLLAFVGATIPAGIYAKLQYGTSLSNVDWLHGGAESLLALTNLFIVLGLRGALKKINDTKKATTKSISDVTKKQSSV